MAKADLINNNVVPLLIAGILSGSLSATLFRPGAESKGGGGANAAAEPENRAAPGPSSWVADLHPVLEALGAALVAAPGESAEQAAARALVTAAGAKTATSDEVRAALATLRKGLDDVESTGAGMCGSPGVLAAAADTLGGYMLTTGDGEAKSARYGAAKVPASSTCRRRTFPPHISAPWWAWPQSPPSVFSACPPSTGCRSLFSWVCRRWPSSRSGYYSWRRGSRRGQSRVLTSTGLYIPPSKRVWRRLPRACRGTSHSPPQS